jgi:hypothetical protein
MAMMAMTTSSSISVNPQRWFEFGLKLWWNRWLKTIMGRIIPALGYACVSKVLHFGKVRNAAGMMGLGTNAAKRGVPDFSGTP